MVWKDAMGHSNRLGDLAVQSETPLRDMLRNAKDLEGYELRARDGRIGHVQDFFFDDRRWTLRYFVVDTGTAMDSRRVLISPVSVVAASWEERLLPVDLSREQVERSPTVDTQQPVSREHEAALLAYYNWPAYWSTAGFPEAGLGVPIVPLNFAVPGMTEPLRSPQSAEGNEAKLVVKEDHHLRSVRAVTGYGIDASDGSIGHVEDFGFDDATWELRYLVVDTRNWWPGKKVLITPQWISAVGWDDAMVHVRLTRDEIKQSPAYDPARPTPAEYIDQLHHHYRRGGPSA